MEETQRAANGTITGSEDLEARYKNLTERQSSLEKNVVLLNARLESRKRDLKFAMDKCVDLGFDPNNLDSEIQRLREVIQVKLDTFEADIKAGEDLVAPMLIETK
ncbi:MAG TPA: hypothetical protein VIE65_08155 [Methylobacter sp.]